ncbi:MAG: multicopper oxidase domain-containing protein [Casimicrobiaceae bacterium]
MSRPSDLADRGSTVSPSLATWVAASPRFEGNPFAALRRRFPRISIHDRRAPVRSQPHRPPRSPRLVEEWEIVNLDEADHPFHIHTNPLLVTQVNGVGLAEAIRRDTVNVRGHQTVTIRSRFEDCTGVFVLHCHIFNHEDIGMMQAIEVHKASP